MSCVRQVQQMCVGRGRILESCFGLVDRFQFGLFLFSGAGPRSGRPWLFPLEEGVWGNRGSPNVHAASVSCTFLCSRSGSIFK